MKSKIVITLVITIIIGGLIMPVTAQDKFLKKPAPNTPQNIIDKADIKELLEFERFSRDNALWDEMKKCYAEYSYVNISWYQGTGHGFVDASAALKGFPSFHKIYNTEIWLNGNKAVAIMMANVQMRSKIDEYPIDILSDAKLIFRTQKIDGQWYIVSFESIYEKDALVLTYPNSNIHIDANEISKYRASYASMIYLMTRNGMKVNENLPGIDRPDLVEKLYKETNEWLEQK